MDQRLRTVVRLSRRDAIDDVMIGRIPLRSLLCQGLEEIIHWDSEVTTASVASDGKVTVSLADGTERVAHLVVAADGARSRIASELAGRPTSHRLRASGLAGRTR